MEITNAKKMYELDGTKISFEIYIQQMYGTTWCKPIWILNYFPQLNGGTPDQNLNKHQTVR